MYPYTQDNKYEVKSDTTFTKQGDKTQPYMVVRVATEKAPQRGPVEEILYGKSTPKEVGRDTTVYYPANDSLYFNRRVYDTKGNYSSYDNVGKAQGDNLNVNPNNQQQDSWFRRGVNLMKKNITK